jgi:hypothetical protein
MGVFDIANCDIKLVANSDHFPRQFEVTNCDLKPVAICDRLEKQLEVAICGPQNHAAAGDIYRTPFPNTVP